jgi:hypothetical protein
MDYNHLLSSTVDLGFDLLEKNGSFSPFCKAVSQDGQSFVYAAASDSVLSPKQIYDGIKRDVSRDLETRGLIGIAFCFDSSVRFSDSQEDVPAVELEVHYQGLSPSIWYFTYKIDGGKASVLEYYRKDARDDLFGKKEAL